MEKVLEKYLAGASGYPVEWRRKLLRLIENLTLGPGAVGYLVESLHGAGSPMAQRIMLARLGDLDHKERLAMCIAGIPE